MCACVHVQANISKCVHVCVHVYVPAYGRVNENETERDRDRFRLTERQTETEKERGYAELCLSVMHSVKVALFNHLPGIVI